MSSRRSQCEVHKTTVDIQDDIREESVRGGLDIDLGQPAIHGGRTRVGNGQADAATALAADHVKGQNGQVVLQARV